jgi:hypothetical protein
MKLLEITTPTIYLDLDGTMVDFHGGLKKLLKGKTFGQGISSHKVYQSAFEADPKWYANLPWQSGGREVWNYIKGKKIIVLTANAAYFRKEIASQKREWVKKNLSSSLEVIITGNNKGGYGKVGDILIDDYQKFLKQWSDSGGIPVKFTGASTIASLKKLDI